MDSIMLLTKAISNLVPRGTKWTVKGVAIPDDILVENESDMPTKVAIEAEIERLDLEYKSQEYARNREAEFPSIKDLVVALYDTDDKSAIETKRAEIKTKYPKPE